MLQSWMADPRPAHASPKEYPPYRIFRGTPSYLIATSQEETCRRFRNVLLRSFSFCAFELTEETLQLANTDPPNQLGEFLGGYSYRNNQEYAHYYYRAQFLFHRSGCYRTSIRNREHSWAHLVHADSAEKKDHRIPRNPSVEPSFRVSASKVAPSIRHAETLRIDRRQNPRFPSRSAAASDVIHPSHFRGPHSSRSRANSV
jgi:hypothetical protein